MNENQLAKELVDAAIKIHTCLGRGLLESIYETVLAYELQKRGPTVVSQQPIPGRLRRRQDGRRVQG